MQINKESIMVKYIGSTAGNPSSLGKDFKNADICLYEKSGGNFVLTSDVTFQSGKTYYLCMKHFIVEAKYGYNKLWANAGRNLAGSMTGEFLGVFPKLILQFGKLTKTQLEIIAPILDASGQNVTYYDPNKRTNVTMDTYTGDWELTNKQLIYGNRTNEGFSCSFIAVRKRV